MLLGRRRCCMSLEWTAEWATALHSSLFCLFALYKAHFYFDTVTMAFTILTILRHHTGRSLPAVA